MPRRREIAKREIPNDPIYDSALVTKFINCVMTNGKRSTAERILYQSFDIIKEKTADDPVKVFKKAIDWRMPPWASSARSAAVVAPEFSAAIAPLGKPTRQEMAVVRPLAEEQGQDEGRAIHIRSDQSVRKRKEHELGPRLELELAHQVQLHLAARIAHADRNEATMQASCRSRGSRTAGEAARSRSRPSQSEKCAVSKSCNC